jgi:hypothetical protein
VTALNASTRYAATPAAPAAPTAFVSPDVASVHTSARAAVEDGDTAGVFVG